MCFKLLQCGFFFLALFFISCNTKKKDIESKDYSIHFFSNGSISDISIHNDSNLGTRNIFFDSIGNILSIENKINHLRDGQIIWFYPNGIIENTAIYKNNKENGAAFMFYENGSIKNHRYWLNGKREGYTTDFIQDSIGTLKNIYYYQNDTVVWSSPAGEKAKGISINPVNPTK